MADKTLKEMALRDLVQESSGIVLEHLLNGSLREGVSQAIQLALAWQEAQREARLTNRKVFEFTAEALDIKEGKSRKVNATSAWTDGLSLSSDHDPICAYRLKPGKHYRITVQELDK